MVKGDKEFILSLLRGVQPTPRRPVAFLHTCKKYGHAPTVDFDIAVNSDWTSIPLYDSPPHSSDDTADVRAALQEAIDNFEGMNDDEINAELLPRLRAALSRPPSSVGTGHGLTAGPAVALVDAFRAMNKKMDEDDASPPSRPHDGGGK